MIKKFNELVKLDLTKFTQKKPTFYKDKNTGTLIKTTPDKWLDYIEWAKLLELLYENGAESVAFFSEIHKEKPNTLTIHLIIDAHEYVTDYPIIDGNSIISTPNQMNIHKAELRGFVKCVAISTGLGLSLWMKEENQLEEVVVKKEAPTKKEFLSPERFDKAIEGIKAGTVKPEALEKYELTSSQKITLKNLQS